MTRISSRAAAGGSAAEDEAIVVVVVVCSRGVCTSEKAKNASRATPSEHASVNVDLLTRAARPAPTTHARTPVHSRCSRLLCRRRCSGGACTLIDSSFDTLSAACSVRARARRSAYAGGETGKKSHLGRFEVESVQLALERQHERAARRRIGCARARARMRGAATRRVQACVAHRRRRQSERRQRT